MVTMVTCTLVIVLLSIYLLICRYFRFHRMKSTLQKYANVTLNYRQAQEIAINSGLYEMPFTIEISQAFALFKTYGIPRISQLLVQTGQLADENLAGRRAEDTGMLLVESILEDIDSERARKSLARINYLHGLYKNKISNDDMLYTLALFICEPIRWIKKYEWRSLTTIEEEARFILWKEIGERMHISNIPSTIAELKKWSGNYEAKYMIYSKTNQICGEATLQLMLSVYPKCMRGFIRKIFISVLEEKLRRAMGFEEVPLRMKRLTMLVINFRAFCIRHFVLPRIYQVDRYNYPTSCPISGDCRYYRTWYTFEPWYVRETWWNQWWPFIQKRPGPSFKSHGFKVEELGPEKFSGQGVDIMAKDAESIKKRAIAMVQ